MDEDISPFPSRAAQSREGHTASRSCPGKTHDAAGSAADKSNHPGILAESSVPSHVCTSILQGLLSQSTWQSPPRSKRAETPVTALLPSCPASDTRAAALTGKLISSICVPIINLAAWLELFVMHRKVSARNGPCRGRGRGGSCSQTLPLLLKC